MALFSWGGAGVGAPFPRMRLGPFLVPLVRVCAPQPVPASRLPPAGATGRRVKISTRRVGKPTGIPVPVSGLGSPWLRHIGRAFRVFPGRTCPVLKNAGPEGGGLAYGGQNVGQSVGSLLQGLCHHSLHEKVYLGPHSYFHLGFALSVRQKLNPSIELHRRAL